MDFHLAHLLSFPNTAVETCHYYENSVVIKVTLLNTGIYCPHCDRFIQDINQNRPILVRDLPAFGKKVYLEVPRRQFKCSNCRRYFTENLDYIHAKRGHTIRYEQYIYERVIASNIGQVCREESLKYDEIKAMFDARAESEKKNDWSKAERINIDEFSARKGHKNFQTVIGDPDNGCLLDVIDGHTQEKVTEALMKQPIEIRENVKEVSVDMWGGFPKVIRQVFANAQIIIDRFHVMKMVNEALNDLRKNSGVKIKNSRYLLLKNGADLREDQQEQLREILSLSPTLNIAYEMKENLRCIYEDCRTPKSGRKKIEKWLRHARILWPKLCETISRHIVEICNYFISRLTNGFIEGVNNKIKLIKRQGYGFTNMNNFRNRLMASFRYRPSSSP